MTTFRNGPDMGGCKHVAGACSSTSVSIRVAPPTLHRRNLLPAISSCITNRPIPLTAMARLTVSKTGNLSRFIMGPLDWFPT